MSNICSMTYTVFLIKGKLFWKARGIKERGWDIKEVKGEGRGRKMRREGGK